MKPLIYEWICEVCKLPIADRQGGFEVPGETVKGSRPKVNRDEGVWSIDELIEVAQEEAKWGWHAYHWNGSCVPADTEGYAIAIETLRTPEDLLTWTADLMAKNWFPDTLTSWSEILRRAIDQGATR